MEKMVSLVAALKQCALEASGCSIKLQNDVISEAYEFKCLWVQLSLCQQDEDGWLKIASKASLHYKLSFCALCNIVVTGDDDSSLPSFPSKVPLC
ncbi:hypothetical protein OPV22_030236 [Ensete ventricosum]|uniref:Uncharacterized protein n=1 Tax=Ensete ventricosum TaxID=4639 RepID=A0AAV8Q881_ENSVE|nr:hypothetical protein OPV22_030236 [Ensete ventricosum]